jgi:hypothetical protein
VLFAVAAMPMNMLPEPALLPGPWNMKPAAGVLASACAVRAAPANLLAGLLPDICAVRTSSTRE